MKSLFIFTCLLIGLIVCSCRCKDDKLQLQKREYLTKELRTDGFYYGNDKGGDVITVSTFFFYINGVFLNGFPVEKSKVSLKQIEIRDFKEISYDEIKYQWGLFLINDTQIEIETWEPTQCGMRTFYQRGKIINDTTFNITYEEYRDDGEAETIKKDLNIEYKFYKMDLKPDSTNNFIK